MQKILALAVFKKELNYYLRNKLALLMLFFVPTLLTIFFGGLYSYHKVTEVKIAVIDEDNSALSRTLAENFDRSDKFTVVENLQDSSKIAEYLEENTVNAVILIPADFAKNIKRTIPVEVGTFLDGSNMLIVNTVLSGANEIIQTMQAGAMLKQFEGLGVSPVKAKNLVQLIQFRSRIWYNPTFDYTNFMVLGLIGTVIQQILLFQTAQAFIRDRNNGKALYWKNKGLNFVTYFFSKTMFYWLAGIFNVMLTLTVEKNLFGIPIRGGAGVTFLLIATFSAAVTTFGLLFSIIAKTEIFANQYAMIVASPAFLISGFTWPFFAMPLVYQWIGKSIPLTHFLLALRAITLRGAGFSVILPYITVLLGMTVLFTVPSLIVLARNWKVDVKTEAIHESI